MSEHAYYRIAALRTLEHAASAQLPPNTLMQRAGQACADFLLQHASTTATLHFLAGPGNNGGDALTAAALLRERGVPQLIWVWLAADPTTLPADAAWAWCRASLAGVHIQVCTRREDVPQIHHQGKSAAVLPQEGDWIIDGLFGIGLQRGLTGIPAALSNWAEAGRKQGAKILALDVPSGLNADTGHPLTNAAGESLCIQATHTLTFLADKPGLHTAHGRDLAGKVSVADLGWPALELTDLPRPCAWSNAPSIFNRSLSPRSHASHKGQHGHLGILGGSPGMVGAPLLAARAALKCGAGRVTLGFTSDAFPAWDPQHAELMLRSAQAFPLDIMQALVIGPGLGSSPEAQTLLAKVLESPVSCVLDADALNLLASDPTISDRLQARTVSTILTPHPLEAARLLGWTVDTIQQDRLLAAEALANRYRAIIVLKGSGTIVHPASGVAASTHPVLPALNPSGNAGLASAGTGDVLAGLIGALLAQAVHHDFSAAFAAACAAVWLHGSAADLLVQQGVGPIGLTAGELADGVRILRNQLSSLSH